MVITVNDTSCSLEEFGWWTISSSGWLIHKYVLGYFLFLNDHISMILTKIVARWAGPGTSAIWTIGDYRWLFHTDFHPTSNLLLFVGLFFLQISNCLIYSTLLWLKELFVSRMDLWDNVTNCDSQWSQWNMDSCLFISSARSSCIHHGLLHTYIQATFSKF